MEKGWNIEYISSKIVGLENQACKLANFYEREKILEDINLYQDLIDTLEGSVGKNFTIQEFLDAKMSNEFIYPTSINKYLMNIYKNIIDLPRFENKRYDNKIDESEAYDLVLEFIKETYGQYSYQVFKEHFLKNKEYIYYDKVQDNSFVTSFEDEIFICLGYHQNMGFLASLIHEAGHVRRIENNDEAMYSTILGEYESTAYEIPFYFWLIKNNIYRSDAIKSLYNYIALIEETLIMRVINNKYKLSYIADEKHFSSQIEKLNLKRMFLVEDEADICNIILQATSLDIANYYLSLIAFLNSYGEHFITSYYDIINNLRLTPDYVLLKRNSISLMDLSNYKSLRKKLDDML